MNILMLAPLPPPSGGIASWTVRYKEYCESYGINLEIVNIAMQGARATREVMTRSVVVEAQRTIGIIINLCKQIRAYNPSVIHLNTACSSLGVIRDALCVFIIHNSVPVVLHCRCNIEDQLSDNCISSFAFRYLVKKSNKVIVLNKFSKKYVDTIETGKACFIPNFANKQMIEENHLIRGTIKKVVYVGHVEKSKGIVQVLEAAKNLPEIRFELIGAIRENLSDAIIPPNIVITGRVSIEKVQQHLRDADVFIFPSLSEGFSNSLLEAMSMGLPVIASDVGANSEMIEDQGGIILKKNTGEELVNAIKAINDPEIRKDMSEWNIHKVKSSYLIESVMKEYFKIYRQAMGLKEQEYEFV